MSALLEMMDGASSDPLQDARRYAASGGRVIGLVGADVPFELIAATGAMPVALPAFADEPTPHADRYLEPSFSPYLRSIIEQWLQGRLDFMATVIFTRGDDSAQRAYYYLCELQRRHKARGPAPLIFDIAKIPRAASIAHTQEATRTLAHEVSSDPARLPQAIAARDRRRSLFARLEQLRRSAHSPPGSQCERILRLADSIAAERFDHELADWLDGGFPEQQGPRVLLAGTTPPDGRVHQAVERAGGCIVAEFEDTGNDRLGPSIGETADPIAALAHHYHSLEYGPRAFGARAARLASRAAVCAADAVIWWLIEEDEAGAWQAPATAAALAAARIPMLSLTRRAWHARDGALEQIEAFTRKLRTIA
jgi:benzoyl-CoA reductase/2-hydroxyglutaryl-CoA dehydratase subunit BcrC/BadD/HgdB